jgi:uncharacterized membrane protein/predicted DsbA family dithiol-disulfide isomerase
MESRSPLKKAPHLAYHIYYYSTFFFTLTGLVSCIYLTIVHFRNYTDPDFTSICALSKSINCDTVAQSSYSILLSLPVAVWGLLLFLIFTQLAINTRHEKHMGLWWLFFALGFVCSAISLYYGYISARIIHSYCIFCLLCYLCFFGNTFLAFIIIRRFHISPGTFFTSVGSYFRSRGNLLFFFLLLGGFALLQCKLPQYWKFSPQSNHSPISSGRTETGAYWIGAAHPKLTIEEYADYMCFQCGKMHIFLRNLVYSHPDEIRLVHHNFPMDHLFNPLVKQPFHVGAGQMALLVLYAGSKSKFWEMNDELYRLVREDKPNSLDIRTLADHIGFDSNEILQAFSNPEYLRLLNDDIRQGLILRINSTPSYVINGKVYTGTIPLEILNNLTP